MGCEHVGGPELIQMAEDHLRSKSVSESSWPGSRFRFTENLDEGMWASVITEIERRDSRWIVTRIDRRREKALAGETGFRVL
jgi:hypothetical protein